MMLLGFGHRQLGHDMPNTVLFIAFPAPSFWQSFVFFISQICQLLYVSRNGVSEWELFKLLPDLTWVIWAPLCYDLQDRHVLTFRAGALLFAYEQVRRCRLFFVLSGSLQLCFCVCVLMYAFACLLIFIVCIWCRLLSAYAYLCFGVCVL